MLQSPRKCCDVRPIYSLRKVFNSSASSGLQPEVDCTPISACLPGLPRSRCASQPNYIDHLVQQSCGDSVTRACEPGSHTLRTIIYNKSRRDALTAAAPLIDTVSSSDGRRSSTVDKWWQERGLLTTDWLAVDWRLLTMANDKVENCRDIIIVVIIIAINRHWSDARRVALAVLSR